MKKVLFILPTLSAGGAENYAFRFIKYNLKAFDFHVLSVNMQQGDLYDSFKELKIPIFHKLIGYFNLKKVQNIVKDCTHVFNRELKLKF